MKITNSSFTENREMTDDRRSRGMSDDVARDAEDAAGSGGGNYDVFNDEIKVYKYEGEQEPPASETLSEDKRVLVTDVEENIKHTEEESLSPEDKTHLNGLLESPFSRGFSSFSSFIPPYPYPGCSGPFGLGAVSVPHHFPFYNDFFAQPPPAHMGFPSWSLATPPGFCPPTPMYGLPGQAPPFYGLSATHQGSAIYPPIPPTSFYPSGFSPVHTWPHGSGYPFSCFPQLSKFQSPSMLGSHLGFSCPGISHAALVSNLSQSNDTETPQASRTSIGNSAKKLELSKMNGANSGANKSSIHSALNPFPFSHQLHHHHHHHHHLRHQQNNVQSQRTSDFMASPRGGSKSPFLTSSSSSSSSVNKAASHIKKPLNAFMLFMKENRQTVIDECTLKESSAINQILGRKWHSLERDEQMKYYEMAKREKELHRQLYPSWTARDNYAIHARKRRRKEIMRDDDKRGDGAEEDRTAMDCMNAKKCRARYGVEQQHKWCKPCRRKKRCIRFMHDNNSDPFDENEDDNSSVSAHLGTINTGSNSTNNNSNNNNNPSVADSTTEIFSPSPSTNADDSRNRSKPPQQLDDPSETMTPPANPCPPQKRAFDSVTVRSNFSATSSSSSSSSSSSAATRMNPILPVRPPGSCLEYLPRSTTDHRPRGGDEGQFFALGQEGRPRYPLASTSFSDVPSPEDEEEEEAVLSFSNNASVVSKTNKMQAATIF